MKETMGEILAKLRAERGYSQKEAAAYLQKYGVEVSNQAVSKWEKNMTQPNAAQFLALCSLYQVKDVMAAFTGRRTPGLLDGLNEEGRKKVQDYAKDLLASGMYGTQPRREQPEEQVRRLPLYRLTASAGTGQFLDGDDYDLVEAGSEVPLSAHFGVRLAGDSMEPRFVNGQIVWVSRQQELRCGDIGLFLYDGNAYCKKLAADEEGLCLVSLNRKYPPIRVREDAEFRVFGRVVG